jgi:hypothetical protein
MTYILGFARTRQDTPPTQQSPDLIRASLVPNKGFLINEP